MLFVESGGTADAGKSAAKSWNDIVCISDFAGDLVVVIEIKLVLCLTKP